MSSVRAFAESWTGPLDLLVNNAGVMAPPKPARPPTASSCSSGRTTSAHFVLTGLLLPALLEPNGRRVVTVASIAHHGGGADVLDGQRRRRPTTRSTPTRTPSWPTCCSPTSSNGSSRGRGLPLTSVAAHPGVSATGLFSDSEGMGANRVVRARGAGRCCGWSRSRRAPARGRSCTRRRRPSRAPTPGRSASARRAADRAGAAVAAGAGRAAGPAAVARQRGADRLPVPVADAGAAPRPADAGLK